MPFKLNKESAIKFAIYLYDNKYLGSSCEITKKNSRIAFKQFRKILYYNVDYYTIFWASISAKLLKPPQIYSVLIYKEARILKFKQELHFTLNNNDSLEVKTKNKVFVTQSVAFNKPEEKEEIVSNLKCLLCGVSFKDQTSYEMHLKDKKHEFRFNFKKALQGPKSKLKVYVENFSSPKDIILRPNESYDIELSVENPQNCPYILLAIKHLKNDDIQLTMKKSKIKAKSKTNVMTLKVCIKTYGLVYFPILAELFDNNHTKLQLPIELIFHVHSDIYDDLHASGSYKKSTAVSKVAFNDIIKGERPKPITIEYEEKIKLKKYPMDQTFITLLNTGLKNFSGITEVQSKRLNSIKQTLDVPNRKNCLNEANYTEMLDLLLFIEEHQMQKDIHDYDCSDQKLKALKNSKLLELEVPGLAEHRPSLLRNDSVFVREDKNSLTVYEGVVHNILQSSVELAFCQKFRDQIHVKNMNFHVSFSYNRFTLKVEHQAVELCANHKISSAFFPSGPSRADLRLNIDLNWTNKNIKSNPEQCQAVKCILEKTAKPYPYLIFGPPGTGKTLTVVEAIHQIYKTTNDNILVCAPSNNAANEITKRLANLPKTDMIRLLAASYNYSDLPECVIPYTNYRDRCVYFPSLPFIMKYRVVVTTLMTASRLANAGVPAAHFAYVFIDESGHATESETLIAIAGILSSVNNPGIISGQIVLAGDPKQLGPVIHSKLASEYGFGTSMLERLMGNCDVYRRDDTNKYKVAFITKLLKNYRSHPAIIKPSNDMFYEGEIEKSGDNFINLALGWEVLPNPNFPVVFHSVAGIDEREKNSPSFFNIQEIDVVMKYLEVLIGAKLKGTTITGRHIGIIAPYRKQVQKLKKICEKKNYKDIFIGSVEQIQGQERLIIIISTVRSKPAFLKMDNKFNLGFLNNPKRLNVAISRAKALLIIIGNPRTLQYDENWEKLLLYCKENKSFIGDTILLDKDESLCNEFESLLIEDINFTTSEDGPCFSRGNI